MPISLISLRLISQALYIRRCITLHLHKNKNEQSSIWYFQRDLIHRTFITTYWCNPSLWLPLFTSYYIWFVNFVVGMEAYEKTWYTQDSVLSEVSGIHWGPGAYLATVDKGVCCTQKNVPELKDMCLWRKGHSKWRHSFLRNPRTTGIKENS